METVYFLPSNNGKYLSQCSIGHNFHEECQFKLVNYRQINIFDIDRIRILRYPLIVCTKHRSNYKIDPYYPHSNSFDFEIYLNENEWLNGIEFYIVQTQEKLSKNNVKKYRYTFKLIQYLWRMIWRGIIILFFISFQFKSFLFLCFLFIGERYKSALDSVAELYAANMQEMLRDKKFTEIADDDYDEICFDDDIPTIDELVDEFRGERYRSKHLLSYICIKKLLDGIQQSYIREKWKEWKQIYHEKQIEEFNMDATFGLCSKLYAYNKEKWHKLKLSFAHIQDGIGFIAAATLLANASEAHDKTLDFISNVIVENLKQCKQKIKDGSFTIKIGTDASKRDINVPQKILPYLYKKLNLENETFKIYINDENLIFNFDQFQVLV